MRNASKNRFHVEASKAKDKQKKNIPEFNDLILCVINSRIHLTLRPPCSAFSFNKFLIKSIETLEMTIT